MNVAHRFCFALTVALALGTAAAAGPDNVLIVMNGLSEDSIAVSKYYAARRGIERKYICKIYCTYNEVIDDDDFEKSIRTPIKKYMLETGIKGQIDYIVLTKGVPIRTKKHWGVDSALVCLFHDYTSRQANPYYRAEEPFSHRKYQIYLVTRLDGLTVADAKALVDRSLAARRRNGLFLIDVSPAWDGAPGYRQVNDAMRRAAGLLKSRGFEVELEDTADYVSRTGLMGYYAWASGDREYRQSTFNELRFEPGSIAEIAVSTSAYTLTGNRTLEGKRAYITDLVAQGVTGVKGYVYEPYTPALAEADILFDRYTSGYNLADSFYAASKYIHWRGLVLGDPLCAPYRK